MNEPKKRGRPAKAAQSQDLPPTAMETAMIPVVAPKNELVLEGSPKAQLQFAKEAADALMTVVSQKKNPVMIRGEQYIEYGDWQTLARFFGATAGIEWTKGLENGWEARAVVYRNGVIISSAEAMCTREERNWKDRDEFMVRSMAQTRAASKALRNAFGWVAELAGYKATPAEEMDGVQRDPMPTYQVPRKVQAEDDEPQGKRKWQSEGETANNQKEQIKTMLWNLGKRPQTLGAAQKVIHELTGVDFTEENYDIIVEALEERLANQDPAMSIANDIVE